MTEESRVSRTPRTWIHEGDLEPADRPEVRDRYGRVWGPTGTAKIYSWLGRTASWPTLLMCFRPLTEVLPDAPEPQPAERPTATPGVLLGWTVPSHIEAEIYQGRFWGLCLRCDGERKEAFKFEREAVAFLKAHAHGETVEYVADSPSEVSSVSPEGETTPGEGERRREAISGVLVEVAAERARQDAKWGEQNHPDIWPDSPVGLRDWYANRANDWKRDNAHRVECGAIAGMPTDRNAAWDGILLEEVYEALAEADPAKLRAELIQVAAVAVNWVGAIDRRRLSGVELRDVEERDDASEEQP